jgi:hypothetical protein
VLKLVFSFRSLAEFLNRKNGVKDLVINLRSAKDGFEEAEKILEEREKVLSAAELVYG